MENEMNVVELVEEVEVGNVAEAVVKASNKGVIIGVAALVIGVGIGGYALWKKKKNRKAEIIKSEDIDFEYEDESDIIEYEE
ncbi:MAG: hypothetical protein K9L62_01995 [Vallitaleaceae bacterium]|nr:hypothetical protein [Vallitaleaceae bacterium]